MFFFSTSQRSSGRSFGSYLNVSFCFAVPNTIENRLQHFIGLSRRKNPSDGCCLFIFLPSTSYWTVARSSDSYLKVSSCSGVWYSIEDQFSRFLVLSQTNKPCDRWAFFMFLPATSHWTSARSSDSHPSVCFYSEVLYSIEGQLRHLIELFPMNKPSDRSSLFMFFSSKSQWSSARSPAWHLNVWFCSAVLYSIEDWLRHLIELSPTNKLWTLKNFMEPLWKKSTWRKESHFHLRKTKGYSFLDSSEWRH